MPRDNRETSSTATYGSTAFAPRRRAGRRAAALMWAVTFCAAMFATLLPAHRASAAPATAHPTAESTATDPTYTLAKRAEPYWVCVYGPDGQLLFCDLYH